MQAYLDNASTTRPYKEVIEVMSDVAYNHWGNPSSSHGFGDNARRIIEDVRSQIAADINASPEEIIFTSGACEANTLAIKGYMEKHSGTTWWTSRLEHSSIEKLATQRAPKARFLPNDHWGIIYIDPWSFYNMKSLSNPSLVSVSAANGEIGTIQRIKLISSDVHKAGGIFHTDATQLFPENQMDVKALGIDMMSVSAQKFHGPRGAGFLYVRNGIELKPIIYGSQENELRGGTYNTAAIAGMGKALEITRQRASSWSVALLRDRLLARLGDIDGRLNGLYPLPNQRLANNLNITFNGVNAEKLITLCSLYNVYISKGSACNSYNPEPSKTLQAIGLSDEDTFNTVRITLDEFNTDEEIDYAANIITRLVERIRYED